MDSFEFFSMSDNLYYLDQIGSVDKQLQWLKSFNIVHAQHVRSRRDGSYVMIVHRSFYHGKFYLKMFKVLPGLNVGSFLNPRVVNLPQWFLNHGYVISQVISEFKKTKSCTEEDVMGVGTTAVAVDLSPSGV